MFVHPELERRGLALIGWTVRGLDTVRRDPERVSRPGSCAARNRARSFFFTKAHRAAKDPEFNPRCLELTLNGLAERGYRCVIPADATAASLLAQARLKPKPTAYAYSAEK